MKTNIFSKIRVFQKIEDGKVTPFFYKEGAKFDEVSYLNIPHFTSLMINSDIKEMGDTCTILLPLVDMKVLNGNRLVYTSPNSNIPENIYIGDKVSIEFGVYKTETELDELNKYQQPNYFIGYIREFNKSADMIEIVCEDSMYLLKERRLRLSYPSVVLSQLVEDIIEKSNASDYFNRDDYAFLNQEVIGLGKFKTEGLSMSGAEILQKVKEEYKLFIYFKNVVYKDDQSFKTFPTLFAGLKYPAVDLETYSRIIEFIYPYDAIEAGTGLIGPVQEDFNIKNMVIKNGLNYLNFDKTNQLVVVGSSTNTKTNTTFQVVTINGKEIVTVANDPDGKKLKKELDKIFSARSLRVDVRIGDMSRKDITDIILSNWRNHPEQGFEGTFTTFCEPVMYVGDRVKLTVDVGVGDKELIVETYYVDGVKTTFNFSGGAQQEIRLGSKISN